MLPAPSLLFPDFCLILLLEALFFCFLLGFSEGEDSVAALLEPSDLAAVLFFCTSLSCLLVLGYFISNLMRMVALRASTTFALSIQYLRELILEKSA